MESQVSVADAPGLQNDLTARERGVTLRVVLLSLAIAAFFGYVIPVIDVLMSNTFLGAQQLPPGAVGALLVVLLVINPLTRLLSRRWAFSRNEVLTVYITCLFSTLVPGHGSEGRFVSNIIGPFYFATNENGWLATWQQYLKPWFTPALYPTGNYNRGVVESWYIGLRPGEPIPWDVWLVPLLAWGALTIALYIMLGCLSVILRAQWGDHEALAFPLLRLPLEMTEDLDRPDQYGVLGRFFRNPLMWLGFGIAVFIQTLNSLNLYFPDVPRIPLELPTGAFFSEPPWNQIGWTPLMVWPIAVGISYLLTSEISFSLWFFYWFIKLQYIGAYYMGFMPNALPGASGGEGKIFTSYQRIGAYLAYVAIVLWTGRHHFRHIARRAFGRAAATPVEKSEALSYPLAFWGFVLSFSFLVGWCWLAGLTVSLAFVYWGLYVVIAIGLSRVVAEGGFLFVAQGWSALGSLGQIFSTGPGTWLSPANGIVPASYVQSAFMDDLRGFLMPSFVQGFKLAHDRRIAVRPLLALIFAVILLAFGMSLWMNVRIGYLHGCLNCDNHFAQAGARAPAWFAGDLINGVSDASWSNSLWVGVGMFLTYALMLARSHLVGFPLHPIGLLVSLSSPMNRMWSSIFLGWLCKVLITRFGGIDSYRKVRPAFLGLVLGDVAMMLFWLIIDGWQGRTGHHLSPD